MRNYAWGMDLVLICLYVYIQDIYTRKMIDEKGFFGSDFDLMVELFHTVVLLPNKSKIMMPFLSYG